MEEFNTLKQKIDEYMFCLEYDINCARNRNNEAKVIQDKIDEFDSLWNEASKLYIDKMNKLSDFKYEHEPFLYKYQEEIKKMTAECIDANKLFSEIRSAQHIIYFFRNRDLNNNKFKTQISVYF